ncbi:MAG: hypothetical protein NTZ69_16100 [Bacteroidia bacterium]|nr:hypothetical protein [Bacteroidia bacterium]
MNNAELKEYLSDKIDTNHKHTFLLLEAIREQTTKTNGRVNTMEVKLWEVVRDEASHVINCPNVPLIKALQDENQEIRIIKKYPKVALGILVFFVVGALFAVYLGYSRVDNELDTIKARQGLILNEKTSPMKK